MPPLLAALLMIELGCDLRIVEAIDLGQEWRHWQQSGSAVDREWYAYNWYAGWLGCRVDNWRCPHKGTYLWPGPGRRYQKTK
jgi:hypothetical protein